MKKLPDWHGASVRQTNQDAITIDHSGYRPPEIDVALKGLEVRCIIGLYPRERLIQQPLEVDVVIHGNVGWGAVDGDLSRTVNYAELVPVIEFVLQAGRFRMIETAADALAHSVLGQRSERSGPELSRVAVTIRKPKATEGRGVPSVALQRAYDPNGFPRIAAARPQWFLRPLYACRDCWLLQTRVAPDQTESIELQPFSQNQPVSVHVLGRHPSAWEWHPETHTLTLHPDLPAAPKEQLICLRFDAQNWTNLPAGLDTHGQ